MRLDLMRKGGRGFLPLATPSIEVTGCGRVSLRQLAIQSLGCGQLVFPNIQRCQVKSRVNCSGVAATQGSFAQLNQFQAQGFCQSQLILPGTDLCQVKSCPGQ